MAEYKAKSARRVCIREPKDIRRVVQMIMSRAFQEGAELEYAHRLAPLMNCWLKSWELEKVSDIESRLAALEQTKEREYERRY